MERRSKEERKALKAEKAKLKKSKPKKPKQKVFLVFTVIFLVLGVLTTTVGNYFNVVLTVAMEGSTTNDEMVGDTYDAGLAMNVELEEEGIVLLKNEDQVLPLQNTKVNLFGNCAVNMVYNGSGSSAGSARGAVTLKEGLEKAGFSVNENLLTLIANNTGSTDSDVHEGNSVDISNYPINELPISAYKDDCSFDKLKNFSDTAVVCIGRVGGEGQDLPRSGYGKDQGAHYLELSDEEKELLSALKEHGFTTTVLINSSYAMELGFLDKEEYGVSGALWIGGPGIAGSTAVGEVLAGTVNPSGRLADTYAYDLTTQSSFVTSDYYYYNYAENPEKQLGGFTNYSEGIYVGYRWYETADAEGYWDDVKNEYGTGYEGVVQYPFGYGLSYTEFGQSIKKAEYKDGVYTFEVEVENTGNSYAGKDVIQLYCETPYENGGLEKSKVALCAFDKSGKLDPGEKETYTLTVKEEDLASYDSSAENGTGAYVLEKGTYKFYLSDNAHSWADIEENAKERFFSYTYDSDIVYNENNKRDTELTAAVNQLEGAEGDASYLSRADGFANADDTIWAKIDDVEVAKGTELFDMLMTNASAAGEYQGEILDTATGKDSKIALLEMKGLSYEDEKWNDLISQMSVDDMNMLIGTGGWSTAAIDSIGKAKTTDIDGPFGLSNYVQNELGNSEGVCVSYCSEVVVASTWNLELVRRYGETVGNEANATGVSGWYAPGANLHRSSFGGRNPEYYSEDPLLSGKMCANETAGALSKGLYVYIKHFAFNDQEANRTNKENCWMTEQTAREIYLEPFRLAVTEGGATGLMASYMWINGTWCGGNYNLMTNIVRGEWGFQGMVITDNYCANWMDTTKAIMAGTDLILSNTLRSVDESVMKTDEGISAMKKACKNILYTISDAAGRREVEAMQGFNWWKLTYISTQIIFYGLSGVFLILYLRRRIKNKKQ